MGKGARIVRTTAGRVKSRPGTTAPERTNPLRTISVSRLFTDTYGHHPGTLPEPAQNCFWSQSVRNMPVSGSKPIAWNFSRRPLSSPGARL